jgi:Glycosyl hydrolase catalytic core
MVGADHANTIRQHTRGAIMQAHSQRLMLAFFAITVVLASSQPTAAQKALVGVDPRFGAVESYYRPGDAVEAGVAWERIIFEWRYLQPDSAADWDTSHIPDRWLHNAQRDRRMVVGLIKNAPHWATGSDLLGAPPKGLDLPIDDPGNTWAAFLQKLVLYYGERWDIHHWIIYNEPDIRPEDTQQFEFAGTVEDYYRVVKVAYKAMKYSDPRAVIHLAGFTFWQDVVHKRDLYLERFLRLAALDPEGPPNKLFFDVLTVHVFSGTDWVWRMTTHVKSLPESFGFPKPVWINELNVRVTADGDWPIRATDENDGPVSLADQAAFIVQGSALALAAGVERIAIYRLYDDAVTPGYEAWGLVRGDGTRRPGYYALKTVTKYFGGTTRAQRFSNMGITGVTLSEPGRTVYVIWNTTNDPLTVRVKAASNKAADTVLVSDTGDAQALSVGQASGGSYDFDLSPCTAPCFIQGAPRILVQTGVPQAVWAIVNGQLVRIS